MSYTIETIIKVDGGAYPFRTKCEGSPKDKDFSGLLAKHTEAVQVELIRRGCEGSIVLKPTEKHPLEEVFSSIGGYFRNAEDRAKTGRNYRNIDEPFSRTIAAATGERYPTDKRHWTKMTVRWAVTRLIKMGFYKTLPEVLQAAVEQATKGKGQRHGGDKTPFLEQPWVRLYKTHGLGFLLGQADKKYHEALGKENEADQCREILGAIVYLGMALLVLEGRVK